MNREALHLDAEVQAFIEGRLDGRGRAAVRRRLRDQPALAAEIEAMRRQQAALREVGREILSEPVPARLRRLLRRDPASGGGCSAAARSLALTTVASGLLLTLECGGGVGLAY